MSEPPDDPYAGMQIPTKDWRQPSAWQRNWWRLLAAMGVIVAGGILIGAFLFGLMFAQWRWHFQLHGPLVGWIVVFMGIGTLALASAVYDGRLMSWFRRRTRLGAPTKSTKSDLEKRYGQDS
jgi:MFS family permease